MLYQFANLFWKDGGPGGGEGFVNLPSQKELKSNPQRERKSGTNSSPQVCEDKGRE